MNKNFKLSSLCFIAILLACFVFYKCQPNESDFIDNTITNKRKLNITLTNWQHFKEDYPNAANNISKFGRNKTLSRDIVSVKYDFWINDERVQIIEKENYTTYTFVAHRSEEQEGILENYIYKEFTDGNYKQFLLTYKFSYDYEGKKVFDSNYLGVEQIDDDSLVTNRDCVPHFTSETVEVCEILSICTGSPGGHEIGDDECECEETIWWCKKAGSESCEDQEVYTFHDCPSGSQTDDNSTDPNNPDNPETGGGSGNNNDDGDNDDEGTTETVPIDDNLDNECNKIDNFLTNNSNFKTVMLYQATNFINGSVEYNASKFKGIDSITVDKGTTIDPQAKILDATAAPANYEAMSHTHYEDSNTSEGDTYSVFSPDDLFALAKLSKAGKLETNFTAYLATGKNTYYALTITDIRSFQEFFKTLLEPEPTSLNFIDWNNSRIKIKKLFKKYFDLKKGIIHKDNANTDFTLGAFLAFINEANLGINLFKTDANFNNFTRVTYNPTGSGYHNQIKEEPCTK